VETRDIDVAPFGRSPSPSDESSSTSAPRRTPRRYFRSDLNYRSPSNFRSDLDANYRSPGKFRSDANYPRTGNPHGQRACSEIKRRETAEIAESAEEGGAFGAYTRTGSSLGQGVCSQLVRWHSGVHRSSLRSLRSLFVLCAFLPIGCGPKVPKGTWVEREELGRAHSGGGANGRAGSTTTGGAGTTTGKPVAVDLAKLDAATIDQLDLATCAAVIDQLGDRKPAARVALRAARLAHHQGDDAEARAFIMRATNAADESEVHAELSALAAETAETPVDRKVIAVLLPLSGRFAALGSELRVAIELAPPEGVSWLFIDTKGEPDGAAAAVESAWKKGAVAILGPVGTREATAAARAASLHGMPIGLLAPADGADAASGVFRLVGSPADEGRAVARIAQGDSFQTVAVFAPRDDVGQETAEAFVAEAKKLGLSVTKQATYDPTDGNLEPDVKELLDMVPARNPRLKEHLAKNPKNGWKTFSPDVPFSLLYIPDRYDRAAIVAAFLPYFGVELRTQENMNSAQLQRKHGGHVPTVVQLIGGAGWHHPSLPVRGGEAVQGAFIVDAFAGADGGDVAADFAAAFQQKTNRTPSAAAAEAFDAATLIAKARATLQTTTPDPRGALRTAMARAKLDDGACGPASMDTDGELGRVPALLEVQADQIVLVP
jgi:ABC-type branched-subunit amino acid transport system substrate-binding protein